MAVDLAKNFKFGDANLKVHNGVVDAGHPDFTGANNAEKVDAAIQFANTNNHPLCLVPESLIPYDPTAMPNGHLDAVRMVREGQQADVFDVKAYGAAGDSSTDDSGAIQAAVDAAKQSENPSDTNFPQVAGQVVLPPGNFFVASGATITLADGVRFSGAGFGVTTISHGGGSVPVLDYNTTTEISGLVIEDLTISGTGSTTTFGVRVTHCTRGCSIRRVGVKDCDVGIQVTQSQTIVLDNIVALVCTTNNLKVVDATAVQIKDCRLGSPTNDHSCFLKDVDGGDESVGAFVRGTSFQGSQKAGLFLEDVNTVTVVECFFENNNRGNNDWGFLHAADGTDNRGEILNVIGCFFSPGSDAGATSVGIHADRAKAVNLIGTHIRGNGFNIGLETTANVEKIDIGGSFFESVGTKVSKDSSTYMEQSRQDLSSKRFLGPGADSGSFSVWDFPLMAGEDGAGQVFVGSYDNEPAIHGSGTGTAGRLHINPQGNAVGIGGPDSAPADADVLTSEIVFWIDEANNELEVKVKKSDGAVLTATLGSLT